MPYNKFPLTLVMWPSKVHKVLITILFFMKEGVDCNVSLGPANNVRVEISSGECPCEPCSTNGPAMEKELYIESVGDAGSSGASKS